MTQKLTPLSALLSVGLNAPFGARCFMTVYELADIQNITAQLVLMHRLALGAL